MATQPEQPAAASYRWTPDQPAGNSDTSPDDLARRLRVLAEDRTSPAAAIVHEASTLLVNWIEAQPIEREAWGWRTAGENLERGLAPLALAHGWRATFAFWLDSLRRTLDATHVSHRNWPDDASPRLVLLEELGFWLSDAGDLPWDGVPLTSGNRLPARAAVAPHALRDMERGEHVLVVGDSQTVALALGAARRAGLAPQVTVGESAGDQAGRCMARRLMHDGIPVHLVFDVALGARLGEVDRLWTGTEAIGGGSLLGRVGITLLMEEARRREVPVEVLATSDKLMPGGEIAAPAWSAEDTWLLWESAPEGVRVDSQMYECVPADLVSRFVTEAGRERAAELALRALRTETAPSRNYS